MAERRGRVLLIHDEPEVASALSQVLEDAGLEVHMATSAPMAIRDLRNIDPDAVITRNKLPLLGGRHVIRAVAAAQVPVPVVVTSRGGDLSLVVELMRSGAVDCVLDPLESPGRLAAAAERAVMLGQEQRRTAQLRSDLAASQSNMARMLEAESVIRQRAFETIAEPLERSIKGLQDLRNQGLLGAQKKVLEAALSDLYTVADKLASAQTDASKTSTRSVALVGFHPLVLVESVRDAILRPAHRRGVEVAYFVPGELPPLRGDPQQLTSVLVDLCQFLIGRRTGGAVHLALSVVSRGPGPWLVRFDISDGEGSTPVESDDRIEAYLPGDDVATVRDDLIDLSLSARRVSALGGDLALFEQRGVGMRFSFEIALLKAKNETHALDDPGLNPSDVLVAEPHGQLRRCMSNELVKLGMRVATAGSADQAVALLERAAKAGQAPKVVFVSLSLADRARLDAHIDGLGASPRRVYLAKAGEYAPSSQDALLMMRPPKRQVLIEVLRRSVGTVED